MDLVKCDGVGAQSVFFWCHWPCPPCCHYELSITAEEVWRGQDVVFREELGVSSDLVSPSVFLSYVYLYGLPTALLCTNLVYNGSSDLRQLHKQDNIPPLIIHRAFRLVILILYFPLVRICQYHPDNWTLNGEISRQDPVRSVVKLSYWFQAREDRITIH